MIREAFEKMAKHIVKPVTEENICRPKGIICVQKTIYPEGKAMVRKDGSEWYGISKN